MTEPREALITALDDLDCTFVERNPLGPDRAIGIGVIADRLLAAGVHLGDEGRSEGPGLDALHSFDYPNLGFAEIREGLDPTYGDRHPFPETRSPREPAPARSAPSLDEGLLGKAVVAHRMKFWASEPCVENCGPDIAAEYSRLAQEGEIP